MAQGLTGNVYNDNNTRQLKNWIINGGFDVWQRGISQTSSGYGSDDRWNNENATSTKTHSQQAFTVGQTDVPNNPKYFSRTVVTTGGTANSIVAKLQKIEDVTKLAGKTISLSFWAKAGAPKNVSIEFTQNFGTGGSASVLGIGVQKFSLTTSWQRFTVTVAIPSVSGKTVGDNNFLQLALWFDAGSDYNSRTGSLGNQSGTFDIANVSLVEGSTPVEWQTEAYADVLRQCQRYYYLVSSGSPVQTFENISTYKGVILNFHNTMRIVPTISYTKNGSGTLIWNYSTQDFLALYFTGCPTGLHEPNLTNITANAEL